MHGAVPLLTQYFMAWCLIKQEKEWVQKLERLIQSKPTFSIFNGVICSVVNIDTILNENNSLYIYSALN
jgi:hypothetical protein